MEALRVLSLATRKGVRVYLAEGRLMAAPGSMVDDELRAALKRNKEAVTDFLAATQATLRKVLVLADMACERFGDGAEAKTAMVQACLSTPPELLDDLLIHFRSAYGSTDQLPPSGGRHA